MGIHTTNAHNVVPYPREPGAAFATASLDTRTSVLEGTAGVMGAGFTLSRGVVQTNAVGGNPTNYYPGIVYGTDGLDSYNAGGLAVFSVSTSDGTVTISDQAGNSAVSLSTQGLVVEAGSGSDPLGGGPQPFRIDWVVPNTQTVVGTLAAVEDITSVNPPEDLMVLLCQPSTSGRQAVAAVDAADTSGTVRAAVYSVWVDSTRHASVGASAGSHVVTLVDDSGNTSVGNLSVSGTFSPNGVSSSGDIFATSVFGQSGAVYQAGAVGANSGSSGNPPNQQMQIRCNFGSLPGFPSSTLPTLLTTYTVMYFAVGGVWAAYVLSDGSWHAQSGLETKRLVRSLDPQETLRRIQRLSVSEWESKNVIGARRVGPMAEDFYREFRLGTYRPRKQDRTRPHHEATISSSDVAGVALVGIQALLQRVKDLEFHVRELDHRLFMKEVSQ